MLLKNFLLFTLCAIVIRANPITKSESESDPVYRLPNNTIPLRYDIDITTNLHHENDTNPEKFQFFGKISIQIRVLEVSNYVTVHAKQLRILKSSLINERHEQLEWLNTNQPERNQDKEFLTYHVKDYLHPDEILTLTIEYSGFLREDNAGFYRSSYVEAGQRQWLASTQFAPADARHAFPCYDEPQRRVVFGLTINAHADFHAVANMPVKSRVARDDGFATTIFEDSPRMQPYIFAFVVSKFDHVEHEPTGEGDIRQRVYGRPEAIQGNDGDFALETGVSVLRYQQEFFNLAYDLPKMDQLAVPDFAFGAMENWGLVTYREQNLLNPVPSVIAKRQISSIVAHEYAHQFFGNLVAPNWWYYVWLNEGFATFYDYEFNHALFPEYRSRDYMLTQAVQYALERDATEETRPMTAWIENANDVFKSASTFAIYQKAASVLRMFQHVMTEETFKKGVTNYLKERKYDVADSDDLARHLERACRDDGSIPEELYVKDLIESWSLKSGYPVVNVEFHENGLTLTQKKFSYKPNDSEDIWIVPISIINETMPDFEVTTPSHWLNTRSMHLPYDAEHDWVIVNVQETGYFRVNYANELWMRLNEKLKSDSFEEIHYLNRAQLIDDAFNLARANHLTYSVALQIAEYLVRETEFVPWISASNGFTHMNRLLEGSEVHEYFKRYLNMIFTPLYQEMGIEDKGIDEHFADKLKRTIAMNWACMSGDQSCVDDARQKVQDAIADPKDEPVPDIRAAIYCNGLRQADSALFDRVWRNMALSQDQGYRRTLIQSMGCAEGHHKYYLDTTLIVGNYREQEKQDVLNSVFMNGGSSGVEAAIDYLLQHFRYVESSFIGTPNPVKNTCRALAEYVTKNQMEKYNHLLATVEAEGLMTPEEKEKFEGTAHENIEWFDRNEEEFRTFFRAASVRWTSSLFAVLAVGWIVRSLFEL